MTKKEMIKLINKKLDVYFYDWEVKKVLDLCHKIYNDGQAETIAMLKHHNEAAKIKREKELGIPQRAEDMIR